MYKHTLNLIKNKILVYITMEELKAFRFNTFVSFFSKQNISSAHKYSLSSLVRYKQTTCY